MVLNPRTAQIFGERIFAGDFLHLISEKTNPVKLTTWSGKGMNGEISIGHYCLISPGVSITSADSIKIGDNCMLAANCYLSDSDWHGLYNRLRPFRCTKPIVLKDNVWLGYDVKVGKGITIGHNSVVAAGSVVVSDVPDNVVVGGNPAKVIKQLSPNKKMLKREFLFRQGDFYQDNQSELDRYLLDKNGFLGWLKSIVLPTTRE